MQAIPSHQPARPTSPRPSLTIHVVCAWCDRPMRGEPQRVPEAQISHGICQPCARQYFGIVL